MNEAMQVFDARACALGEGPLWHPGIGGLFWFDILEKTLFLRRGADRQSWQFDEYVSAAGWIDDAHLMIASETSLMRFNFETGAQEVLHPLEADNPVTRSNDGRADPWGGFWIGTMGKNAETGAGAIYRYYQGTLETLLEGVTISNAICFSPDRRFAYFTDTAKAIIMRWALEGETGTPLGQPESWIDLRAEGLNPDGAVVDADGCLWNAQWGAARVAVYGPDGVFRHAVPVPAPHATCPAFGGPELTQLFVTSAAEGDAPQAGALFTLETKTVGQAEHRVILP